MNDEQKARVIANCEVIAKALREGRSVQYFNREYANAGWIDGALRDISTDLDVRSHLEYRLKPEPRTIWVNEKIDGYPLGIAYRSPDDAAGDRACFQRIAVEYREVVKP